MNQILEILIYTMTLTCIKDFVLFNYTFFTFPLTFYSNIKRVKMMITMLKIMNHNFASSIHQFLQSMSCLRLYHRYPFLDVPSSVTI